MSKTSIHQPRKKRKNWRKHLAQQRWIARYDASIEVVRLETQLQMRLSPQAWDEIEARWQAMDYLDACLPEQRRDFLLHEEMAMEEALQCSPTA